MKFSSECRYCDRAVYRDDVFKPPMRFFPGVVVKKCTVIYYNVRPHIAQLFDDYLECGEINRMGSSTRANLIPLSMFWVLKEDPREFSSMTFHT